MSELWRRLEQAKLALGVGTDISPFYFMLSVEPRSPFELLLEATFSPESVVLDDNSTDVMVVWGSFAEIRRWVDGLADEFEARISPEDAQSRLIKSIFLLPRERNLSPDPRDPWLLGS